MSHIASPVPQGIGGIHHISHLSPKTEESLTSRSDHGHGPRRSHALPVDDVRIGDRARIHMMARAVDLPPAGAAPDNPLLGAAREALQFLDDHPRMAQSPFGKAVGLLVRAAAHMAGGNGLDGLPDASKAKLMRAVETVEGFLKEHPRVAEAPIGGSAAALARGIASSIRAEGDNSGPAGIDRLMEAAKKADLYLDDHPKLASMPLGQVVEKLVEGAKSVADGNPLDVDLQTLAKRVGHFVHSHPRLAESEFGQIVSHLVRGIAAFDASSPPAAEPPVAVHVATEAAQAEAVALTPGVTETAAEEARAAA